MAFCAFDTNVLAYAAGIGETASDRPKVAIAEALLSDSMINGPFVLPVQVCFELHRLLVRKRGLAPGAAADAVRDYMASAIIVSSDLPVLDAAFEIARSYRLQTYDAAILASAARAGCDLLYSEDMQNGFERGGVRIVNPFA